MILRVCDNGTERIVPASPELVDQVFAPEATIADGTEITLTEGERWLAALAVGTSGGPAEFLLSGAVGETRTVSGQTGRSDALRRFREFLSSNYGQDSAINPDFGRPGSAEPAG
jgi:hypothetical protein